MSEKMSKKDNVLQALKFAAFSASAGVVQVVTFTLLNEFKIIVYLERVIIFFKNKKFFNIRINWVNIDWIIRNIQQGLSSLFWLMDEFCRSTTHKLINDLIMIITMSLEI